MASALMNARGRCRACRARIIVARNEMTGKALLLDGLDPARGDVLIDIAAGTVRAKIVDGPRAAEARDAGLVLYMRHSLTCGAA